MVLGVRSFLASTRRSRKGWAAQAEYTPGYSASDMLFSQATIATGMALGGLGILAAENSGLGVIGKTLLGSTMGYPQLLLDGFALGQANAAGLGCE
jgi:hypothetical protein